MPLDRLKHDLSACTLCADRFAATETAHAPKPLVWFEKSARLLIASQAPGMRAHHGPVPFMDASGDRLRDWLGLDMDVFYDRSKLAIVPMGFCFPGYDAAGGDLPPPRICAKIWRERVLAELPGVELTLLIGGHAQTWHLGPGRVTDRVAAWRDHAPRVFPLPHPSWRNTAWLKRHPWFEAELLPALRARVAEVMR